MRTKFFLKALLQTSAITTVAMGTAFAQDASPKTEAEDNEVVVTGSRIKQSTFTSPVSIDVLTVEDAKIEGVADIGGLLQTSTAISGSSQITSAVSSAFIANGGLGAENVGLRGLAANRTLDLINGRRAGPSGIRGSISSFDLNSIPLLGVERVDILKDGASSIYGSDAIAGVINYVTDKSDAKSIDLFTEISENGGGEVFRGSATYGETFERGRFRITADYIKEKELARKDRKYLDCNEDYTFTDASLTTRADVIDPRNGNPKCAGTIWGHVWVYDYGSDNVIPNRRNRLLQYNYGGELDGILPQVPASLNGLGLDIPDGWHQVEYFTADALNDRNDPTSGFLAPYAALGAAFNPDSNVQNAVTNTYNPLQRDTSVTPEQERITLMFDGDYEFDNGITAYGEALFNRRENYRNGITQYFSYIYGANSFGNNNTNPIAEGWNGENSWFSPTPVADHGDESNKIDYFRLVGGLKGKFGDNMPAPGWDWDLYAQHSDSDAEYTEQIVRNDSIRNYNIFGGGPTTDGVNPGTRSCQDSDFGNGFGVTTGATREINGETITIEGIPCVDVRWFDQNFLAGDVSAEERAFLFAEDTGSTKYTQTTVEGYTTGDLFKGPGGMISAAAGVFYQRDEITDRPSDTVLTGNEFLGSTAGITTGVQSTTALYGELSIPIVSDKPLFEDLSMTASGRYSEITSKNVDGRSINVDGFNYRLTANWQMIPAFRVRGSIGTSFRAPGLFEQFLANETSGVRQSVADICIGVADLSVDEDPAAQTIIANCAADGIPLDHGSTPIAATATLGGGFGQLEPESSKNYTIGGVITPDFEFGDLSLAIDYFDITIKDEITSLSAASVIRGCYASQNFENEPLCDFFRRERDLTPGEAGETGSPLRIVDINARFQNVNSQRNTGLDFTLRYGQDTDWGRFNLSSVWSRQLKDETQLLAESRTQFLNGGIGEPKLTGTTNFTFEPNDDILLRYGVDYIGGVDALRSSFPDQSISSVDGLGDDGSYSFSQDGTTVFAKRFLEATIYHSVSAQYTHDSWAFRAGVNNLFDEHPPATTLQSTFGNSPIVSQYDLLGRRFFLNVSKNF